MFEIKLLTKKIPSVEIEEPSVTIYAYIIGHYNPSIRIIDPVSHTTYVVCVNFIYKWRDLQFKVDFERQIFLGNFTWQFYLLPEFLPEIY